jgi:alanine racemase
VVTVDLSAVRSNIRLLKERLRAGAKLMAVVKADGYGHGAAEVGLEAAASGADALAVVTADEAVRLRDAGFDGELLVIGPLFGRDEFEELAALEAEIAIGNQSMARALADLDPDGPPVALHLKVDTGMNRQGLSVAEVPALLELLRNRRRFRLKGIMTHFACADCDPECVHEQLARFLKVLHTVRSTWPGVLGHVANSAATLNDPATHLDMVRCGIAIYGLSPFQDDARAHGLVPALTWRSTVVSTKDLSRGEAVGYGHTFRAADPTRIGLVPVGYADGVRRALGGLGAVLIRGHRYPMCGRVSMDSFTVDLGPKSDVVPGDSVTLIGDDGSENLSAEWMGGLVDTLNYEITCGIGTGRVRREFVGRA